MISNKWEKDYEFIPTINKTNKKPNGIAICNFFIIKCVFNLLPTNLTSSKKLNTQGIKNTFYKNKDISDCPISFFNDALNNLVINIFVMLFVNAIIWV